jgi:hypothetical protein
MNEFNQIPFHIHNGKDAPKINPKDLLGFPSSLVADATVAPSDVPKEGTFRFLYDTVPVRRLWAYVGGGWRYINLT